MNINGFVLNIINLSAFAAVAVLLFQGEITVGTGVATLGYIESFLILIQYIVESINAIVSTKEVKEKVLSYTEYRPALQQELPAHAWPLDLEGVTVEYDGFSLRNFSYTFRPGKKYAVIGHNGSGKSTLFHAILKYAPLSQGEVRLGTYDAKDYDVSKVMADVCQHEHMFAVPYEKNVTLFGAYSAEKLPEIEGELQGDTLDMVRGSADCTTLSGGQQQLVHLIRLLLSDQPVLLLDEPFSAMDKANRDQLQASDVYKRQPHARQNHPGHHPRPHPGTSRPLRRGADSAGRAPVLCGEPGTGGSGDGELYINVREKGK